MVEIATGRYLCLNISCLHSSGFLEISYSVTLRGFLHFLPRAVLPHIPIMKYQAQLAIAVTLAQCVTAFPAMNIPLEAIPINKRQSGSISGNDVPDPASTLHLFDPKLQYVSNTGKYAWVAPGPDDARGPCPGLNAMANHGYLPHNGVATIPEFIQGTFDVFGMVCIL